MPTKKAAAGAKIVDVVHPDSVKADPTSVPLIVKHRPILKDPMVVEAEPADDAPKKSDKTPIVTKITLAPVSADGKEAGGDKTEDSSKPEPDKDEKPGTGDKAVLPMAEPVEAKPEELPAEPEKADVKPPEPEPDPEPETKETEAVPEPAEPTPAEELPAAGGSDELLPGTESTDPAAAKAAREAAERQLALDKLVADQTYFLPINAVEKRKARTNLAVLLLLVVVLGGVGFLAALDAGYVHINGLSAPTDFIHDK